MHSDVQLVLRPIVMPSGSLIIAGGSEYVNADEEFDISTFIVNLTNVDK